MYKINFIFNYIKIKKETEEWGQKKIESKTVNLGIIGA
jgi:hypothetical protein